MYTAWTKHIKDPNDKADFERRVLNCSDVLERLKQLLQEEEAALDRSEIDIKVFDQPNWAERQAFKNGFRSGLNVFKKLVDLDQQKGPISQ